MEIMTRLKKDKTPNREELAEVANQAKESLQDLVGDLKALVNKALKLSEDESDWRLLDLEDFVAVVGGFEPWIEASLEFWKTNTYPPKIAPPALRQFYTVSENFQYWDSHVEGKKGLWSLYYWLMKQTVKASGLRRDIGEELEWLSGRDFEGIKSLSVENLEPGDDYLFPGDSEPPDEVPY